MASKIGQAVATMFLRTRHRCKQTKAARPGHTSGMRPGFFSKPTAGWHGTLQGAGTHHPPKKQEGSSRGKKELSTTSRATHTHTPWRLTHSPPPPLPRRKKAAGMRRRQHCQAQAGPRLPQPDVPRSTAGREAALREGGHARDGGRVAPQHVQRLQPERLPGSGKPSAALPTDGQRDTDPRQKERKKSMPKHKDGQKKMQFPIWVFGMQEKKSKT